MMPPADLLETLTQLRDKKASRVDYYEYLLSLLREFYPSQFPEGNALHLTRLRAEVAALDQALALLKAQAQTPTNDVEALLRTIAEARESNAALCDEARACGRMRSGKIDWHVTTIQSALDGARFALQDRRASRDVLAARLTDERKNVVKQIRRAMREVTPDLKDEWAEMTSCDLDARYRRVLIAVEQGLLCSQCGAPAHRGSGKEALDVLQVGVGPTEEESC